MKPVEARAFYRTVAVGDDNPPFDTLHLKVCYPCKSGSRERGARLVPADTSRAPYPVIVMLPGANQSQESCNWLAEHLVETGFVVLSYDWRSPTEERVTGTGPGLETKWLKHRHFGKKPSCPLLKPVFKELKRLQKNSVLKGLLDLDKVVLGGHAEGGLAALVNANPDWFPQVRGAFSYAAHAVAESALGWEKNSVMPLSRHLPMLLMGGTRDGVLGDDSPECIERTFREGIKGKRGDRHLVIVSGANHFAPIWPVDNMTGLSFLDKPAKGGSRRIRRYLARLITNFCDHACTGNAMSGAELQSLADTSHKLVAIAEHK